MTPQRYQRIRQTLDRRQPDLTIITDRVHKPHNVSAILRTCDAVGMHEAHVVMPDDKGFRARSGIAMGSDRWVNITMYTDPMIPIEKLHEQGYQTLAAHLSPTAVDFRDIDYTRPTALLMGTEKFGVSDVTAEAVSQHVIIPMMGMVESFNVSVAAAIILSEAQRQRTVAGMYDQVRLSDEQYRDTLFRWGHAKVADYCDRHQLPYPELDEEGQIINFQINP